jgi:hypothetical protein
MRTTDPLARVRRTLLQGRRTGYLPRLAIPAPTCWTPPSMLVRGDTWADRNKPQGWRRFTAPLLGLGLLGAVSISFPQLLGNGKDVSQLVHTFPDSRRIARRRAGACVVLVLARCAPRIVRCARCGSRSRGDRIRPDLDCGVDDGTDWSGPVIHRAAVAGCGYRHSRGTDH